MRIPSLNSYPKWRKSVAYFILGFICGSLVFTYLTSLKIHQLTEKVLQLNHQNEEYLDTIKALQKKTTPNDPKIRKITVLVKKSPDDFAELEVSKRVKKDLHFLLDKSIEKVAEVPDAIIAFLDGKRYTVNERTIRIEVNYIAVGPETTISISLQEQKSPGLNIE